MPIPDWIKRHVLPDFLRSGKRLARSPRWILVVSPEATVGRLAQVNLERQGYEVSWNRFAEDALVDLTDDENPPRILVIDSAVRDVEFGELLRELKSDPETRRFPLIAFLDSEHDTDTFRQWACGKDCFLRKPFNPLELIACVRRILQDHDNYSGGAPAWGSRV
jgi:two-component system alkaline phosphatase synthesis response regulator PhoP